MAQSCVRCEGWIAVRVDAPGPAIYWRRRRELLRIGTGAGGAGGRVKMLDLAEAIREEQIVRREPHAVRARGPSGPGLA